MSVVEKLRGAEQRSRTVLMDALNHLGMIWCGRQNYVRARDWLEESMAMHGAEDWDDVGSPGGRQGWSRPRGALASGRPAAPPPPPPPQAAARAH